MNDDIDAPSFFSISLSLHGGPNLFCPVPGDHHPNIKSIQQQTTQVPTSTCILFTPILILLL